MLETQQWSHLLSCVLLLRELLFEVDECLEGEVLPLLRDHDPQGEVGSGHRRVMVLQVHRYSMAMLDHSRCVNFTVDETFCVNCCNNENYALSIINNSSEIFKYIAKHQQKVHNSLLTRKPMTHKISKTKYHFLVNNRIDLKNSSHSKGRESD